MPLYVKCMSCKMYVCRVDSNVIVLSSKLSLFICISIYLLQSKFKRSIKNISIAWERFLYDIYYSSREEIKGKYKIKESVT